MQLVATCICRWEKELLSLVSKHCSLRSFWKWRPLFMSGRFVNWHPIFIMAVVPGPNELGGSASTRVTRIQSGFSGGASPRHVSDGAGHRGAGPRGNSPLLR